MVRGARARNGARTSHRLRSRGEDRLAVCALERETPDAARRETLDASRRGGGVLSTHARERSCPTRGHPRGVQHPRDVRIDADEVQHSRRAREVQSLGGLREPHDALAHSVCPTKDLTASSVSGAPSSRPSATTTRRTRWDHRGSCPCRASATLHVAGAHGSRVRRRESPRVRQTAGAVKPLDRPSWFTAVDASDTRPGGI